jgi:hypothetical protein
MKCRKNYDKVVSTEVHLFSRELRLQILSKLPFFQALVLIPVV